MDMTKSNTGLVVLSPAGRNGPGGFVGYISALRIGVLLR